MVYNSMSGLVLIVVPNIVTLRFEKNMMAFVKHTFKQTVVMTRCWLKKKILGNNLCEHWMRSSTAISPQNVRSSFWTPQVVRCEINHESYVHTLHTGENGLMAGFSFLRDKGCDMCYVENSTNIVPRWFCFRCNPWTGSEWWHREIW
jgi:hypothetical protein